MKSYRAVKCIRFCFIKRCRFCLWYLAVLQICFSISKSYTHTTSTTHGNSQTGEEPFSFGRFHIFLCKPCSRHLELVQMQLFYTPAYCGFCLLWSVLTCPSLLRWGGLDVWIDASSRLLTLFVSKTYYYHLLLPASTQDKPPQKWEKHEMKNVNYGPQIHIPHKST